MARVSDWIIGMEQDAQWMSRCVFIEAHGMSNLSIWERVQRGEDEYEPEIPQEVFETHDV